MGKIKSKSIRKTTETLLNKNLEFTENFKENKRILGRTLPSKKIRNQLAGHLVRTKTQERLEKEQKPKQD